MRLLILPALASLSLSFSSCTAPSAIDEHGHVKMVESNPQLNAVGTKEFAKMKRKKKISHNSRYNAQLKRVASRLTPVIHLPGAHWEFVVFEDPTPNAFALPGGKVGVHTGMFQITQNDAGLAAVIGHEIAHVTSNHVGQQRKQKMGLALGGILLDQVVKSQGGTTKDRAKAAGTYGTLATVGAALPFSRRHELESDRIGAVFMAKAGYDPREAVKLWQRFSQYNKKRGSKVPGFLRTHPLDSTRIKALQDFMPIALREYRR